MRLKQIFFSDLVTPGAASLAAHVLPLFNFFSCVVLRGREEQHFLSSEQLSGSQNTSKVEDIAGKEFRIFKKSFVALFPSGSAHQ